jgi:hypothetical protein
MTLNQHSAPGSNAGFSYQFERALFWLAQSPAGFVIGVETDDDVAVRGTDGSQLLEQDKHSIRDNVKPFGDRSKDLWNTLAIWIEALDDSAGLQLRKKTIARLQLPDWCSANSDSIADELLGWLHRTALDSWQQNIPAWIERDSFVNQLHSVINRRKRQIKRERAENLIPVTDDKIGQEKGSPFVKQIYLVTDDDSIADNAIREFIR